jgi:hypothetical protein
MLLELQAISAAEIRRRSESQPELGELGLRDQEVHVAFKFHVLDTAVSEQ